MSLFLYPYNINSESAKLLAEELKIRRIKKDQSKFKGGPNKIVINWGNSILTDEIKKCVVLNTEDAVKLCSDKLNFFNHVNNKVSIVPFTTNKEEAKQWIEEGKEVVIRTILNGHGGKGIIIVNNDYNLINAPLYTMYIKKKYEYRIHIFNGEIFIKQQKVLDNVEAGQNFKIRNKANGFIFARNINEPPQKVLEEALKAYKCIPGLTFCSVDVIYNAYYDKAYVLEINTASGLVNTTIKDYANKFMEYK